MPTPKRKMKRRANYGRIVFTEQGRPLSWFAPDSNIRVRVRCLQELQQKYLAGEVSPEDWGRARRYTGSL